MLWITPLSSYQTDVGYYSKKDGFYSSLLRRETEKEDSVQINSLFCFEKRMTAELLSAIEKGPPEPWGHSVPRALTSRRDGCACLGPSRRPSRAPAPPQCRAQPQRGLFLACCRADLAAAKQLCGSQSRAGMQISLPSGREPTGGQDGCRGAALACFRRSLKENWPFHMGNSLPAPNISECPAGFSWMSLWKSWFPRPSDVPLPSCALCLCWAGLVWVRQQVCCCWPETVSSTGEILITLPIHNL